jgi:hypothetical protein
VFRRERNLAGVNHVHVWEPTSVRSDAYESVIVETCTVCKAVRYDVEVEDCESE